MPECPDYFEFPEVKAIIQRPPEEIVDQTSFELIPSLLPGLIEAWRERIHEELYALIKDSDPTSTVDGRGGVISCHYSIHLRDLHADLSRPFRI